MEPHIHLTATECHLPYGITQCYLPPDTSEHTPPSPQPHRLVLDTTRIGNTTVFKRCCSINESCYNLRSLVTLIRNSLPGYFRRWL